MLGGSQHEAAPNGNTIHVCFGGLPGASLVDVLQVGLIWLDYVLLFMVSVLTTRSAALGWAVVVEVV